VLCAASVAVADDVEIGDVEVTAEKPPLLESVSPVTTIQVEEEEAAGKSLADFLDEAPSVEIVRSGSDLQRQTVTIRGSDGRQVQVLIEGFNLADPQGAAADLSQIPLDSVESIEVYRGGRGALAGSGAMGGIVVIRLKEGGPSKTVSRASTGFYGPGNFDSVGGALSVSGPAGFISWSHEQSEGEFAFVDVNGASRTRTNNDAFRDAVAFSVGKKLSRDAGLTLVGNAALVARGSPGSEQFPSKDGMEESATFLLGSRAVVRGFPAKAATSRATVSWGLWRWAFDDPDPYFGPAIDTESRNQRMSVGCETRVAFSRTITATAGLVNAEELGSVDRRGTGTLSVDRNLTDVTVAALLDTVPKMLSLDVRTRLALSDANDAVVVPAMEASVALLPWLALNVAGGRSYRYPTFDEMYFEAAGIKGNPDLEPEDMWSAEAGLTAEAGPVSVGSSLFYVHTLDSILFLPKTPYQIQAQNTGVVDGIGVESSADLDFDPFFLSLTQTWIDYESEDTGAPLPLRSPWTHHAEARYDRGRWTGFVSLDSRSRFPLDRFNSRTEEGRTLADAGLSFRPGWGLLLSLAARNITDKRDAVDWEKYPLPGMSWHVTIQKEWKGEEHEAL